MPQVIVYTTDRPVKYEIDSDDYTTMLTLGCAKTFGEFWRRTPNATGLVQFVEDGEVVTEIEFHLLPVKKMKADQKTGRKEAGIEALTISQRSAYDRLIALASCYFKPDILPVLKVRPRFFPLIVGPTGVGKTTLAEGVASALKLTLIKVSIASWIPVGSRSGDPTSDLIKKALDSGNKVMLFIDELDKATDDSGHNWVQSILGEVYDTIDAANKSGRMFVVAAGAWQSLHDEKQSMGFAAKKSDALQTDELVKRCGIPKELILRLANPPIRLEYPSKEETASILKETGLLAAAERLGCPIDPSTWKWTGGMRSMENKAAELCLLAYEKSQSSQSQ